MARLAVSRDELFDAISLDWPDESKRGRFLQHPATKLLSLKRSSPLDKDDAWFSVMGREDQIEEREVLDSIFPEEIHGQWSTSAILLPL